MIGKILIYILFSVSFITSITFLLSHKKQFLESLSEKLYYFIAGGSVFVSVYLMSNIFAHNFEYTYIWEYSSRSLSTLLLSTAFFSGQSGSFLLWALLLAIIGIFLMPFAKRNNYLGSAMGIYTLIITFLFLMLIFKNPFEMIWETFPEAQLGNIPQDGRGLNPILQNFWNAIHPPILFIGFAAMSIPFVFAVAGLIQRDYKRWIDIALPWTLFASGMLSLGLMLGGFWAYETLNWGGFWGWDPVENASLIPCLISIALVHTILIQKRTGGMIKTNIILAIASFSLIIYSTFLTRSGILGDSSLHSFGEAETSTYYLLLSFLLFFLLIGLLLFIYRFKDISYHVEKIDFHYSSKEFSLAIGSLSVIALSIFIFIGTSWPIITKILGQTRSSVNIAIYDTGSLPIAIFGMLILAFSVYLNWKTTPLYLVLKKLLWPVLLAAIFANIMIFLGVKKLPHILFSYTAFLAIFANAHQIVQTAKHVPLYLGGKLAHIGIAVLLIGSVSSSGYPKTRSLKLKKDSSAIAYGYNIKFSHSEEISLENKNNEKYKFHIDITKDGQEYHAEPIILLDDFNQRKSPFFEPGIVRNIAEDLYISPIFLEMASNNSELVLEKGKSISIAGDTASVELVGFDMSKTNEADQGAMFGAIVSIREKDENYTDTLYSHLNTNTFSGHAMWQKLKHVDIEIGFIQLIPDMKNKLGTKAKIAIKKVGEVLAAPVEEFTFEFSIKPLINLVWLGTILVVVGFVISIFRRRERIVEKISETNSEVHT